MERVQTLVTDDLITMYWEKVEKVCEYQVYIDGTLHGTTDKTHYTIEGLQQQTSYQIAITYTNENVEKEFWQGEISTTAQKNRIDVTQAPYYAKGDNQTLHTQALQKAIDDCTAQDVVYVPKGIYLTGALRLHSDMELYLEEGAVLQGTEQVEDYLPRIPSRFEGLEMECYSSLLNLGHLDHDGDYNCRNVIIRGKGTIASGGWALAKNVIASEKERLKDYLEELGDKIKEYEKADTIPGRVRPRLINMSNAQNIWLSGLTLKNGASWNVHMIYSDKIVTNHCTFHSEGVWNGDGWDPDSSTDCTIFDCQFFTGDDSIAIKSGKNPQGNIINRPTKHIRIFDCKSAYGHGIAMGSEMSGGIEDVVIWDCDLSNALFGLEIKGTKKRGGYVRDIHVRDCTLPRILFHSVGYNDDGEGAAHPPVFENCSFENIQLLGKYQDKSGTWHDCDAIELCGFDEKGYEIRNIDFRKIHMDRNAEGSYHIAMKYCEDITFEQISCN